MSSTDHQREWVLRAVQRYELPLVRYAARLGLDGELARDCVQHGFLRLCEQRVESLGQDLAPWLYAVVRNRAIDQLRRAKREVLFLTNDDDGPHVNGFEHPFSHEPDPHELTEQSELYALLRAMVDDLPAAQREIVLLWSEGFTHREIAEVTDRGEGAVRVQLHRTLGRLRDHATVKRWLREEAKENVLVTEMKVG